jgi:hypothetical protein
MVKNCWCFRTAVHVTLVLFMVPLSLSASTLGAHAQLFQDFFQLMDRMGTGISGPIVNSYQQVPLSQALTMQPAPVRQPAAVSTNYVNPFGPSGGLSAGPAGTRPNVTCSNNICQLAPPAAPPVVQHNQQSYSYQQYYYPHGSTFSAPAPAPPQYRRR